MSPNGSQQKNWVSALHSALESFSVFMQRVAHELGILVIDKGMRSVVGWYDSRHGGASASSSPSSSSSSAGDWRHNPAAPDTSALEAEIERLRRSMDASRREVEGKDAEISRLRDSNARLSRESEALQAECRDLREQCRQLTDREQTLTEEADLLRRRCLPQTNVPACIYYAQGDTSGEYLRKAVTQWTDDCVYEIHTHPGDTSQGEFYPVVNRDLQYVIDNRNVTLAACRINLIAPGAVDIAVVANGRVALEGGKWKVIEKAIIELI